MNTVYKYNSFFKVTGQTKAEGAGADADALRNIECGKCPHRKHIQKS